MSQEFEPLPLSARAVRHFVAESLGPWGIDSGDAVLLADELACNAIVHARCPYTVTVTVRLPVVRIEVHDGNVRLPVVGPFQLTTMSGRGLQLVDALASSWGFQPTDRGKVVWFELRITGRTP